MASFTNSYSALLDGSEVLANDVGKRRKKVKQQESLAPPLPALQARTSFSSSTSGQGESQPDVESLEGFVPATRSQRSRIAQNTQSPSNRGDQFPQASPAAPEPQLGPRITSQEASHIVEQAATGMNGPHRLRLWSEWLAQLQELAAGYGVRYSGPNGSLVDFRQTLLRSRALEFSVEGCLSEPISKGAEPLLVEVLRALLAPSLSPTVPAAIAARIALLSGLAATDSEPSRKAAATAVSSLVSALKAQPSASEGEDARTGRKQISVAAAIDPSGPSSLEGISKTLATEEAALAQATLRKDKARLAGSVLSLSEQRLALMSRGSTGCDPGSGDLSTSALQSALHSVALWSSQVQDSQRNAALARGSAQTRGQQRHAQGEALQRLDAQLACGQAELATEIRQREEQLQVLRQRKAVIDDQRHSNSQQQSRIRQDLPSSDAHMDPAAYEQQLAAAYCFHQVLQSASSVCACGSLQNGDSLATRTACAAYMHAVQHALEANLEYLTELLKRTQDTSEQLARVRKQGEDLAQAGISESAPDNSRQQERLAARVQDSVKAAAEVWRAATDAEQGMHRYGVLLSQLPSSVGNAVGAIQQLVLRMESTHAAVQATVRPAAPAPRRTSNELMTLLAGSRVNQPPLPPPVAAAPRVQNEHPASNSAPAGRSQGIPSKADVWGEVVMDPSADFERVVPHAEDRTSAVMARLARLEEELESARQELSHHSAAAYLPTVSHSVNISSQDVDTSTPTKLHARDTISQTMPAIISAFQNISMPPKEPVQDSVTAVRDSRVSTPVKKSPSLEPKSSAQLAAAAAVAAAAALNGIGVRGIKSRSSQGNLHSVPGNS